MRGRDREWSQITQALARADRGRRTVLVIEGPPGSGRSRLLDELARAARAHPAMVLEHRGAIAPTALAHLVSSSEERARASRRAGGTAGPVVIVWDDPPWAAAAVGPAVRATPTDAPVLWALTRSTDDLGPRLSPGPDVIWVDVGPLPMGAVAEVVADLVGAEPSAGLLALSAVAAGRPAALGDLIAGLREEELIAITDGRAGLVSARLPRRTQARIARQVAQLPAASRHLVRIAAVFGLSFRPEELAALLERTVAGLLPVVEELLAAGLLGCATDRLAFPHELLRAAIAGSVPAPLRRALHDEIDRTLAATLSQVDVHRAAAASLEQLAWGSLTHSEERVARLVRQAMTNQQIASRLKISTNTVNFHLRRIYRKFNINSRVQLAGLRLLDDPDLPGSPRNPPG